MTDIRALAAFALLCACRSIPDTNPETVAALVEEGKVPFERRHDLKVEVIDTDFTAQPVVYRIGVNDVLHITVVGHPEFTGAGARGEGELVGTRVQSDGKIYPPMLGGMQAAGLTVPELREALQSVLAKFLVKPQASVEILKYESQKFFVLGQVDKPGVFPVNGSVSLLEGVALAGGIRDTGDIEGAYIIRAHKLLPISLGDILLRGETARNVAMAHGDMVYVPDKQDWKVYVLGEVLRPGIVPMGRRGLNVADAMAYVGGIDPINAKRSEIRLFRGSWQKPKAYTLSTEDIYRYGVSIQLKPGDRIIVAPRGLATYSRTVTLLTPFIQSGATAAALAAAVSN